MLLIPSVSSTLIFGTIDVQHGYGLYGCLGWAAVLITFNTCIWALVTRLDRRWKS